MVIDHLGLQQPFEPPAPPEPWADLPKLLALAAHANVMVKITGACTLSHQPFPYTDIWDPLWRIFDAFGLDRCLWGTDWTRAVALLTYRAGRRGVPRHRPAVRQRPRRADGRHAAAGLWLVAVRRPPPRDQPRPGAMNSQGADSLLMSVMTSIKVGRVGGQRLGQRAAQAGGVGDPPGRTPKASA